MKIVCVAAKMTLAIYGILALPVPAVAETWVLMGREGGCVTITEAARRKSEFNDVVTPEDLVQKLRAKGHTVTLREMGTPEVRVVSVEAPSAGLAVTFAPEKICRK